MSNVDSFKTEIQNIVDNLLPELITLKNKIGENPELGSEEEKSSTAPTVAGKRWACTTVSSRSASARNIPSASTVTSLTLSATSTVPLYEGL